MRRFAGSSQTKPNLMKHQRSTLVTLFASAGLALCVPLHGGIITLNATINAAQETNGSTSAATGTAVMVYDVTSNRFDLSVTLENFTEVMNDSHIHEAPPGTSAGVVEPFGGENAAGTPYVRTGNTITGTFTNVEYSGDPLDLISGGAYLNYHTTTWPGGAIRGQLIPEPVKLYAIINAANERGAHTPVDSDAYGAAQANYDPATNMITTVVTVYNFTNTLTNSHIHEAGLETSGPVTLGFGAAAVYENNGTTYVAEFGPSAYPGDPLALLGEGAYVNVHSNVYAPGEIRGQLYVADPHNVGRLVNVSARARVGTGDDVLISGFFVHGMEPVRVLVTARGPGLTTVTGALADPVLNVYDAANNLIFTNDNVGDAPFQDAITGFSGVTLVTAESGVLLVLPPGGYTGIVSGAGATTGVGIAEAFEVSW
jgi:hypothetical protein